MKARTTGDVMTKRSPPLLLLLAMALFGCPRQFAGQKVREVPPCDEARLAQREERALALYQESDHEAAVAELERLLGDQQKCLGEEAPKTVDTMSNIAAIYYNLGRYQDALELNQKVLALSEEILPANHPHILATLSNIGTNYSALGKHTAALELNKNLLERSVEALGPEHPDTLVSMNNLAATYHALGRYGEALELNLETLRIRKRVLGEDAVDTLASSSSATSNYINLGDPHAALALGKKALERSISRWGGAHAVTLDIKSNLAVAYNEVGDFEQSLVMNREIYEARAKKQGPTHLDTLLSLNNLASSYVDVGAFEEAREAQEKAIELSARHHGESHPLTIHSVYKMANLHFARGDYSAAKVVLKEVVSKRRDVLGAEHPDTLESLRELTLVHTILGEDDEALSVREEVEAPILNKLYQDILLMEHDSQMRNVTSSQRSIFNLGMSLPASDEEAFEAVLAWQGLATRAEMQWRDQQRFLASMSAMQRADFQNLKELVAEQRWKRANTPTDKEALARHRAEMADLEARITSKEETLENIAGYAATRRLFKPSSTSVCQRLTKEEAALLQFVAYSRLEGKASSARWEPYYAIFIVTPVGGVCQTKRIDLHAAAVHDLVLDWRDRVKAVEACIVMDGQGCDEAARHAAMHTEGNKVRTQLWDPLATIMPQDTIYIAPDGIFNQLSFGALADAKGTFLIEQKTLRYIPHPAALDMPPRRGVTAEDGLFVGDIDFDWSTDPKTATTRWVACPGEGCETLRAASMSRASAHSLSRPMGTQKCGFGGGWQFLDTDVGTQGLRFADTSGARALIITGKQAHEGELKKAMSDKRVLHFATHGFYSSPEQCKELGQSSSPESATEGKIARRFTDPLQLSALVLSGGNKAGNKLDKPEEDGLLSAREVVRLDLRGTEVVTLAACETGLGENTVGEGSLGLARAFLVAGAKTAFVSHWQVPLADTNALFQRFYADAFPSKGKRPDVVDAYHQVVRASIKQYRMDGNIHSAFFWAAFFPLQIQ